MLSTTLTSSPFLAQAADQPLRDLWFRSKPGAVYSGDVDDLFMYIFWFSAFCFVVLMGLMVYWTVKYRRKPGAPLILSSSHNTALEIAWTVLPLLPLAFFFFKGFHGYVNGLVATGDAKEIVVKAKKWQWDLTYPNGGNSPEVATFSSNKSVKYVNGVTGKPEEVKPFGRTADSANWGEVSVFYIPAETNVRLRMSSDDVIHAFWIPDFRIKQDVMPNRYTSLWFRTNPLPENAAKLPNGQPYEDHWIFCAEYCGTDHSKMMGILRVVPRDYFDKWVEAINQDTDPVSAGMKLWRRNCASCHSIDGTPSTGPSWKPDPAAGTGWGTTIQLEKGGTTVLFDENYVRESILEPQAKIHKGYGPNSAMNSFAGQLKDEQIENIITFMKSLKK